MKKPRTLNWLDITAVSIIVSKFELSDNFTVFSPSDKVGIMKTYELFLGFTHDDSFKY